MSIDSAITLLEAEVGSLGMPDVGSDAWWLIRGKSTGLSLLRTLRQKGLTDPKAAEDFRQAMRKELVA
jgi:hypothetical protein